MSKLTLKINQIIYLFVSGFSLFFFFSSLLIALKANAQEFNFYTRKELFNYIKQNTPPVSLGGRLITEEDLEVLNNIASITRKIKAPQFNYDPSVNCRVGQRSETCYKMGHFNFLGADKLTIGDLISQKSSGQKFKITILLDSENLPHGFDQNSLLDYCYLMYKDSFTGDCGTEIYPNSDPIFMGVIGYVAKTIIFDSFGRLSKNPEYSQYIPEGIYQKIKRNQPISFEDLNKYPSVKDLYTLLFNKLKTYQISSLLNQDYQQQLIRDSEVQKLEIFQIISLEKLFNNEEIYRLDEKTLDTFLYKNPNYDSTTNFQDLLNIKGNQLADKRIYDVFGKVSFWKQIKKAIFPLPKGDTKSKIFLASGGNDNSNAANKTIDEIPGMAEFAMTGFSGVQNAQILAALVIYQAQYRLKEMLNGQIPNIPLVRFDLPYVDEDYAHNTISGGYNWQVSGAYRCDSTLTPPPKQDLRNQKKCSHLELLSLLDLGVLNKGTDGTQWVAGDQQWVEGGLGILRILFGKFEPTGIPLPTESFYKDMANGNFEGITGMDIGEVKPNLSEEEMSNAQKAEGIFMGEISFEELISGMDAQELANIKSQIGSDQFNQIKSAFGGGGGLNETIYAKITMRDLDENEGSAMLSLAFGWCQQIFFYKTCTPRFIHLPGLIKFSEDTFIPLPMPIK